MAFSGKQLLKNVMGRMSAPKKKSKKNPLDSMMSTSTPMRPAGAEAGMNFAPRESSNFRGTQQNFAPLRDARKPKGKKGMKRAKKLPAKPGGAGPFDRSQRDSDSNLRTARKPKPQGRGIVKALGQKKTTGNFAKIEKTKGKGAAIGALQNKLAKRRGQPIPFGGKKKKFAHKGHSHKSSKAMKAC